ncbi:MAG TPA: hypothetical protein VLH15_04225 [Dehalococcoidales bacterium]|nr:hypothetical protein [Dehalococcoidales bacterium]
MNDLKRCDLCNKFLIDTDEFYQLTGKMGVTEGFRRTDEIARAIYRHFECHYKTAEIQRKESPLNSRLPASP